MRKYSREYAALYAALWAYGSEALSLGGTEGVYRTTVGMVSESYAAREYDPLVIVDLGCGVGRLVRDLARVFPRAKVYGLDTSPEMIAVAQSLLLDAKCIRVDLTSRGFPVVNLDPTTLPNVSLHCVDAKLSSPIASSLLGGCDLVVSLNTIERVTDFDSYANTAASLLRDGGTLILASSMNWAQAECWARFPEFRTLLQHFLSMGRFQIKRTIERIPYFEVHDRIGSGECFTVSIAEMTMI